MVEFQMEEGGAWATLPLRLDIHAHSPTGFEWGYGGSGPAQLALALCASRVNSVVASTVYQQYKWAVVASLAESWELEGSTVDEMIRRIRAGETFHP